MELNNEQVVITYQPLNNFITHYQIEMYWCILKLGQRSVSLALCEGNLLMISGFPSQKPSNV